MGETGAVTRVGLVLGGGGYTGTAFHAGVLGALADVVDFDGRDAEVIVGTSAGSTAAALLRAGFPPQEYVARMCGEALSEQASRVLEGIGPLAALPSQDLDFRAGMAAPELALQILKRPWRYRVGTFAAAVLPEGRVSTEATGVSMGDLFVDWPPEKTWLPAVSLSSGRREVFGRDSFPVLGDAVAASCAVPGLFPPVVIDDDRYVDGGCHSVHSLDLLADEALDLVIVSAPMAISGPPGSLSQRARTPIRRQLWREARGVQATTTPVIAIAPDAALAAVMGLNSMDVTLRPEVARRAYRYVSHGLLGLRHLFD